MTIRNELIKKAIESMSEEEFTEYTERSDAEHEEVADFKKIWVREFIEDLDYETQRILLNALAEFAIDDGVKPGEWRALPMLLLWLVALASDSAFLDAAGWIKFEKDY